MISNGICGNPLQIQIDGYVGTSGIIIDEFNLIVGSNNYQEQPQPASLVLRGRSRYALSNRYLGAYTRLFTQDATLGFKNIFVGQITSITNTLVTDDQATFEISAISYLNELLTLNTGGNGFPAANDIERLNAILEGATANEWQDFDTVTTWQTLGEFLPTTTWEQFESFYGRNFDWNITGVGNYDLIAYPAQQASAYDLIADLVSSLRGRIFENIETGTPVIEYFSRDLIQNELFTPYLTIGDNCILRDSVAMTADIANLANNVILNNGTVARSDANYSSIDRFGLRLVDYDSPLSDAADLQTFATEFMKSAAFSRDLINTVGIIVNETTMTANDAFKAIDAMIAPTAIQIDDLPDAIRGRFGQTPQNAITVGAAAAYANGNLIIQYNLAVSTQIKPSDRWIDLNPTTVWTSFATPTTTWAEVG